MAFAFMPAQSKAAPEKQKWIERIGSYRYYALMLANFNPVEADRIWDTDAVTIAEAFVSKLCHEYRPETKR